MTEIDYLEGNFEVLETETIPRNHNVRGYGNKIPTQYMVKGGKNHPILRDSRIRRVYAICYSNTASWYILVRGKRQFIRDWDLDREKY